MYDAILIAKLATTLFVAGGGGAILIAGMRHRRHQAVLRRVGERHSLVPGPKPSPEALLDKIGHFEGRPAKIRLGNVWIGRGESQRVVLATCKASRAKHTLLFFELDRSSLLDGFFVRPDASMDDDMLHLHWRAPRTKWNDERALSMAARVMHNLAAVGERQGAAALGLELDGSRVWVRSDRVLSDQALEYFVNDGMRLRAMLTKSLERASNASRTKTSSGPRTTVTSFPALKV